MVSLSMDRIGFHSLMDKHVIVSFRGKLPLNETITFFIDKTCRFLKGQYNEKFFTQDYIIRYITEQYSTRRNYKVFKGNTVEEAIVEVFKYHYNTSGLYKAFLPHKKIARDLSCCTKTVQRHLKKLRDEGILKLESKENKFKKLACVYTLTSKGIKFFSLEQREAPIVSTVAGMNETLVRMIKKYAVMAVKYWPEHVLKYPPVAFKWLKLVEYFKYNNIVDAERVVYG